MSVVCVCLSIVVAPFGVVVVWVLGLKKQVFPLVETLATTGRLTAHTCGVTKWSTWSEAESCAGGLSWTMRTKRGKLIESLSAAGMERSEMEAATLLIQGAVSAQDLDRKLEDAFTFHLLLKVCDCCIA